MVGDGGTDGCCNEGRESVGRGTGILSRSILGPEVESGVLESEEGVIEEVNETPRGGTIRGGCANI
jgi:hypothetical protein